ncbi:hypothetical protein [Limibacterium fermenti]
MDMWYRRRLRMCIWKH